MLYFFLLLVSSVGLDCVLIDRTSLSGFKIQDFLVITRIILSDRTRPKEQDT